MGIRPVVARALLLPAIAIGWSGWYAWSVWASSSRATSWLLVVPAASLVIVIALYSAIRDLIEQRDEDATSAELGAEGVPGSTATTDDAREGTAGPQIILVVATLAYAYALEPLGFFAASVPYIVILYWNLSRRWTIKTLMPVGLLVFGIVIVVWLTFEKLLGVNLP